MEEKHKVLSSLLEERERWAEERANFQVELSRGARREATLSPPAQQSLPAPSPPSTEELVAFADRRAHTVYDRSMQEQRQQPSVAARPNQQQRTGSSRAIQSSGKTEPGAAGYVDEAKIRSRNEQIFSKLEELEGRLQARIQRKPR